MKFLLVFAALLLVGNSALAERKDVTGDVGDIRYHIDNGDLAPTWNGGIWFQIVNASESFCNQNKVSIPPGNETAVSILLAAKMAGKKVLVTVDDANLYPSGSYCKLQYITVN